MFESWSAADAAVNRLGRLSSEQVERLRHVRGVDEGELREGRVIAVAGSVEQLPFQGRSEVLPALDDALQPLGAAPGLLPGNYWFYVLPRSRVVAGFEARTQPPSAAPLRELPEQVAAYEQALLQAQQLTLEDVALLRAGRCPAQVLARVKRSLQGNVAGLVGTVLFWCAAVVVIAQNLYWMGVGFGLVVALVVAVLPWIFLLRVVRQAASLRRPELESARGALWRTLVSTEHEEHYLSIEGVRRVRVASHAVMLACVDQRPHRLYWLKGSRYFAAVLHEP